MKPAPWVERAGFKSGRVTGAGPTLEELAAMPPWFARAVFGVAVFRVERRLPPSVIYAPVAAPPARRQEPRGPRTALGSGVVRPIGRAR